MHFLRATKTPSAARDDAPDIRSVALCSARSSSSLSDDEESKVLLSFTAAAELGMM